MTLSEIKQPRPDDFCLICGGSPDMIGVFIPENSEAYGAVAGKTRFIRYCLCANCHGKKDTPQSMEKIIQAELAGGGVHHA